MAKNLLIVESPAKAKTINKYLGKDFHVLASYGHVRDLVPKEGAVDPDNGFAMRYELIEKNQKHVEAIAKAAKAATAIYLATDPDREGEAISWHISEILKERGLLKDRALHRVVFTEITPRAIKAAVDNPRQVAGDLVDAQQARRALDYLVGFNLSPVLWRKVQRGLSAGRVQSPALRMIVEREEEIEAFVPREYWSVEAEMNHPQQGFTARLVIDETTPRWEVVGADGVPHPVGAMSGSERASLTIGLACAWTEGSPLRVLLLDDTDVGMFDADGFTALLTRIEAVVGAGRIGQAVVCSTRTTDPSAAWSIIDMPAPVLMTPAIEDSHDEDEGESEANDRPNGREAVVVDADDVGSADDIFKALDL